MDMISKAVVRKENWAKMDEKTWIKSIIQTESFENVYTKWNVVFFYSIHVHVCVEMTAWSINLLNEATKQQIKLESEVRRIQQPNQTLLGQKVCVGDIRN